MKEKRRGDAARALLAGTKLSTLCQSQNLVVLNDTCTVEQALAVGRLVQSQRSEDV